MYIIRRNYYYILGLSEGVCCKGMTKGNGVHGCMGEEQWGFSGPIVEDGLLFCLYLQFLKFK